MSASDDSQIKVQKPSEGEAPPADEGLISLDGLDQIIQDQDPGFQEGIKDLASSGNVGDLNIEMIDLDQLLAEQEARSLKSRLKRLWRRVQNVLMGIRTTIIYFIRHGVPHLLKAFKSGLTFVMGTVSEAIRQFGFKPRRFKILFFAFILLCSGVSFVLLKMMTKGLVPPKEPLFVQAMSALAESIHPYDPKHDVEPFLSSVRVAQNIMIIPKLVANIQRSMQSSRNPMVAIELFIEGISPDVVVEIKDRETEFRDRLMRIMEEYSYDELASVAGKIRLQEAMTREINGLASKGRVRKVYFKTFVLKP